MHYFSKFRGQLPLTLYGSILVPLLKVESDINEILKKYFTTVLNKNIVKMETK
jgi:hypothetical protein